LAGGQNSAEQPGYEPGEMFEEGRPLAGRQSSQKNLLKRKKIKKAREALKFRTTHTASVDDLQERERKRSRDMRVRSRGVSRECSPREESSHWLS